MADNLQKLNNLIEFLKIHNVPAKSLTIEKVENLAEELRNKRKKFLYENIKELKQKIKKNYKKLRIPVLNLMEHDFHENSHSNIIEYLIDYNSFDEGALLLSHLINDTSSTYKGDLCKKVLRKTYTIEREHSISKGRIDLFIWDDKEKFVIIIENKILAGIGETITEDENSIPITQLKKYEKWCNETYPDYIRLYILLNFSNSDDSSLFEKISYKQLYDILKDLKFIDNISEDYLLLLSSLLNPLTHDLLKIKKLANKIIEDENPEVSLTDYYILKTIFYAK